MSLKWCHILSSWFFLVLVKYVYFASWNNFTENFPIVWHLLRRPEMQVGVPVHMEPEVVDESLNVVSSSYAGRQKTQDSSLDILDFWCENP